MDDKDMNDYKLTDDSFFNIDDEYIEDNYFPIDSNNSFIIPEGSFMDDDNNLDQTNYTFIYDKNLKFINTNIDIYNNNVRIYKMSIGILENYINYLFTTLDECLGKINSVMRRMKDDDNQRNIKRDYTSLLNYITSVYNRYEKFIRFKISELKSYFINTEKNLLKHGHILIQFIWFCYNDIQLPKNNSIDYYENYSMTQCFDNVNKKFQLYFKSLYLNLNYMSNVIQG